MERGKERRLDELITGYVRTGSNIQQQGLRVLMC